MNRRVFALVAVLLWLGAPGVVRAESRAFEFSSRSASMRLLGKRSAKRQPWTTADRIRALASTRHATTVSDSSDTEIPAHIWLVPLILTGAGLVTGITVCVSGMDDGDCGRSVLGGLALGMALGLGYLRLVACLDANSDDSLCEDDEEEDYGARKARARAKLAKATGLQKRAKGLRLPMGLAPSMGVVNDQAVIGLGRSF
ncbi:hypothetical protein LY474_22915 [Myxococcus stipitatus]|uniref:hypothetical protein n=1 Tax=Myxococcus stipitatus TaxID=83455 RepID=UPI001F48C24C|nr:hypothetical protein [Myxococcus stipitatus]MCE9670663.1 hypothetical protein [Myxococcus stipitatus]